MTDKELLELAAKAVGWVDIDWLTGDGYMNVYDTEGHQYAWNPLTDDGDALRLAVKLGMMVSVGDGGFCTADIETLESSINEVATPDPYAATRRAVVRVAAEIGKGIK